MCTWTGKNSVQEAGHNYCEKLLAIQVCMGYVNEYVNNQLPMYMYSIGIFNEKLLMNTSQSWFTHFSLKSVHYIAAQSLRKTLPSLCMHG